MTPENKICQPQDLADRLAVLKRPLVMTNGVFDVLHRGHVSYLHRAAEMGGSLLVAINSDASTRMLGKGADRPIHAAQDRAFVLAGLQSVALVTFFASRTPVELVRTVRPDIYVKGGDYDMETLEETRLVRSLCCAKLHFWTVTALSIRTGLTSIAGKILSFSPG